MLQKGGLCFHLSFLLLINVAEACGPVLRQAVF